MSVYDVVIKRRSIRRFKQIPLDKEIILKLIDSARLAPSAANLQPLRYIIVTEKEMLNKVFDCLRWAAYVAPKGVPPEGKRPVAYIVVLLDKENSIEISNYDVGAACENILLVATEFGIGSCWIGSIDKENLRKILEIPQNYSIESVIALGYPDHNSYIEDFKGSIKYWIDENENFHVPKRKLEEIVHINKFGGK